MIVAATKSAGDLFTPPGFRFGRTMDLGHNVVQVFGAVLGGVLVPAMVSPFGLYPCRSPAASTGPASCGSSTGGLPVSVIPPAVAMVFLQRHWRGGLTDGSVKG